MRLPRLAVDNPEYQGIVEIADAYAEAIEGLYALSVAAPLKLSGGAGGKGFQISIGSIRRYSIAKAPSEGIPARSGSTPGKKTGVPLYRVASDIFVPSGESVTAYNPAGDAVAGDAWIGLSFDGEVWHVDWEDCP